MTDARRIEQTFIPGPSIQFGHGEIVELSWQERALCTQTDPEAFFPEKVVQPVRLSEFVSHVRSDKSVLNTLWHMMSALESGRTIRA